LTDTRYILIVSVAVIVATWSSSVADVITNDAVISGNYLELTQSIPPGEGLFSVSISSNGLGEYEFEYAGIAEEYALFTSVSGEVFTSSCAETNTPFVSNNGSDPGSGVLNFTVDVPVYLSYWDDRNFDSKPDANDNYGWAMLVWDGSELGVSESATALGSGIVVGTTQIVPTPATLHLASGISLSVSGTVGAVYRIEYSSSLLTNQWQHLTNAILVASPHVLSDVNATNVTTRFYRAMGLVQ